MFWNVFLKKNILLYLPFTHSFIFLSHFGFWVTFDLFVLLFHFMICLAIVNCGIINCYSCDLYTGTWCTDSYWRLWVVVNWMIEIITETNGWILPDLCWPSFSEGKCIVIKLSECLSKHIFIIVCKDMGLLLQSDLQSSLFPHLYLLPMYHFYILANLV